MRLFEHGVQLDEPHGVDFDVIVVFLLGGGGCEGGGTVGVCGVGGSPGAHQHISVEVLLNDIVGKRLRARQPKK